MEISVLGAGYVGLVTAACLAHLGTTVRVIDVDAARIAQLRAGHLPIHEPGLDELVTEGVGAGRLSFHADQSAASGSRLVIVAVGTLDRDGEWTARIVRAAVEALAADPTTPRAIVIRSTLLPGTAVGIAAAARDLDPAVEVALNPEFTREASAVADFLSPDRVVIGLADAGAVDAPGGASLAADLRALYEPLGAPIIVTDLTSAETIKLASNVFLAAKITFANELARLCAATGADVATVVDGMGADLRIGRSFLSAGPGYGGSCFPSQARALPALAAQHGISAPIIGAIAGSNERQADWLVDRLEAVAGASVRDWRVALLGLTFKAGTDDLRESPALRVAERLVARGATVVAHDPVATGAGIAELERQGVTVTPAASAAEACRDADAVVVVTEWPEFRAIDWAAVAATMRGRFVVDARRVVDVEAASAAGLRPIVLGVEQRARVPTLTR